MFLCLCTAQADAEDIAGRVVRVIDGDTLDVLTGAHRQIRIRLADIDAPEHDQPYGRRAKQALSALAFGQEARVLVVDHDRYGRAVGTVYVGTTDVDAELVAEGAAWVYRYFNHDPSLLPLEAAARADRRGLWSLPAAETMPPWEWREVERRKR